MKRFYVIMSALLLTLMGTEVLAQKKDSNSDYNLQKAYEVLKEEKDEAKALDLVSQQLSETPDNIDALILRVRLLRRKEDYGRALSDINHALKVNKPKKSGTPASTLHWWKAYIYMDMGEKRKSSESFAEAYRLAQKDNKDNLQSIAFDYAQSLYNLDDLAGADAIYRKMLADDESDQAAMVGLSRNMIQRGEYKEALDILSSCEKMGGDYSEVHRFKFQAYTRLGEETKAIDAGLDWYDKDDDATMDSIIVAARKRPNYAEAQMKTRAKKSENPANWKALLCKFYEESHRYVEAIRMYDELEEAYGHNDRLNLYRSEMAQYTDYFTDYIQQAQYYRQLIIQIAPQNSQDYIFNQATYISEKGDNDGAIKMLEAYMKNLKQGERRYSIVTSTLAYFYSKKDEAQLQERYFLLSAISDMKGAILENNSLRRLSIILLDRGDFKKAYEYLLCASNDARQYGSRLRSMQAARISPLITQAYDMERALTQHRTNLLLIILSVITLLLIGTVVYILSLIKKRHQANIKISKMNAELSLHNEEIERMNNQMKESNRIKDEYIGRFLELSSNLILKNEVYTDSLYSCGSLCRNDKLIVCSS